MANNLQDEILEFKDYEEYNISYPVIVTRWEIKQVRGLNKQYLQIYFQKLNNSIKAFQLNIKCYSTFGKELEDLSNIPIQDLDKKERVFSQVIPLNVDTRRVEMLICQCLLVDGSIIEKNERQMVVNTFKPFDKEDTAIGKELLPRSIGYPIDNITHWYCACGVLNLRDSQKCFACGNEKSKVLQLITKENIQKEKEDLKRKELEKQKELDEQKRKKEKQIKMSAIIGIPLVAILILAIILVCTLAPIGSVSYNGMKFKKVGSTYQLVEYMGNDAEVKIPSQIRGCAVTSIGLDAFNSCNNLTSVAIPNGVTIIGERAFARCEKLKSISIPSSVTSIDEYAFSGCISLIDIIFEDNSQLVRIGEGAFRDCSSLISMELPSEVINIDTWAFKSCSKMTSIVIPSSVTIIGSAAFDDCSSLTIYCEASSKPSGWKSDWNHYYDHRPVVWNYKK